MFINILPNNLILNLHLKGKSTLDLLLYILTITKNVLNRIPFLVYQTYNTKSIQISFVLRFLTENQIKLLNSIYFQFDKTRLMILHHITPYKQCK